jgi:uncharacterized protein
MIVKERIERLQNRFYDAIRSNAARKAAVEQDAQATGFDHLQGHDYALLATYRRSGEAVATPIWFGLDDEGRAYMRTGRQAAKVKRIRKDSRVRVAPCTFRGRPLGPFAEGTARILGAEDEGRAEGAIQSNYGLGRRLYEGSAASFDAYYIEVAPTRTSGETAS